MNRRPARHAVISSEDLTGIHGNEWEMKLSLHLKWMRNEWGGLKLVDTIV